MLLPWQLASMSLLAVSSESISSVVEWRVAVMLYVCLVRVSVLDVSLCCAGRLVT